MNANMLFEQYNEQTSDYGYENVGHSEFHNDIHTDAHLDTEHRDEHGDRHQDSN